jgi:hypothetical protein
VEDGADVEVVVEVEGCAASDDDSDELLVVDVVLSPVARVTPPPDAVVDVVSDDAGTLEPGWSRATSTAITAVAPVAASTAPRVRARRRDCALALLLGLCGSGGRDIDRQPLLVGRRHPNTAGSTPAPDALCASCDIRMP